MVINEVKLRENNFFNPNNLLIKNFFLFKNNKNKIIEYKNDPDLENEEQKLRKKNYDACLDDNHTHFILVDNAKLNKFGGIDI